VVVSSVGPAFVNVDVGQYEFPISLGAGQYARGEIAVTSPGIGPYTYNQWYANITVGSGGGGGGGGVSAPTDSVPVRTVSTCKLVLDQLDFFNTSTPPSRINGIVASDLFLSAFVNNVNVGWNLLDGTNIPDSSVVSGNVYFNEIIGSPGFYSIRFYPSSTGFIKLSFTYPAGGAIIAREFDIIPASTTSISGGLTSSFYK
jgi:hypothetical protein